MCYACNEASERSPAFTLVELLVTITILAILFLFVFSGVQASRATANRIACSNNLSVLGRGLSLHETTYNTLPPRLPSLGDSRGSTCTYEGISWQICVLPFVEQRALFDRINAAYIANPDPYPSLSDPSSSQHAVNAAVVSPIFVCPQDPRLLRPNADPSGIRAFFMSYAGVTGNVTNYMSGVFGRMSGVSYAQVRDGLSNTLMLGERPPPENFPSGWWYTAHQCSFPQPSNDFECPVDAGIVLGEPECSGNAATPPGSENVAPYSFAQGSLSDPCDRFHYWSLHQGGGNFLFADGSVRFIGYPSARSLRALSTIDSND